MKKMIILTCVLSVILIALMIVVTSNSGSGLNENLPYTHSYTKAFCDSNNFCRDFEVFCKNNEIIKIRFTGAAVQFQENWLDPRVEERKTGNC